MPSVDIEPKKPIINESSQLVITCKGRGEPMPSVSWDTKHLTSPFNVTSRDGGSTEDLIILSANASDSGWLTCSARSVAGKTSDSMLLGVNCKDDWCFMFYLCKVNCPSDRKYWDRKYLYYDILEHIKFCLVGQYDRLILFSIIIQNYVQNILLYNKNKEHVRIPWAE